MYSYLQIVRRRETVFFHEIAINISGSSTFSRLEQYDQVVKPVRILEDQSESDVLQLGYWCNCSRKHRYALVYKIKLLKMISMKRKIESQSVRQFC